ncbi:MAG: hypothetical protein R2761_16825 [Acidimicrobiales bacterium]
MSIKKFALLVAGLFSLFMAWTVAPALADGERGERDRSDAAISSGGERAWSGEFCNGEKFEIRYAVEAGKLAINTVTGPANHLDSRKKGVDVVFDNRGKVSFRLNGERRGRLTVEADLGRCTAAARPVTPAPGPTPTMAPTTTATGPTVTVAPPPSTPGSGGTQPTTPPTMPPTQPPTTVPPSTLPPAPAARYLTYTTPAGTFTVELNNGVLTYWAINTPGYQWYAKTRTGAKVVVLIQDASGESDFTVTMTNGAPVASFVSPSGGTITPSVSESTTAPAKSAPSGA